jgi:hypothetical protein
MINDENSTSVVLSDLQSPQLNRWSDEKKKDYVALFQARARASQYILLETAKEIADTATRRRYISDKHTSKLNWPVFPQTSTDEYMKNQNHNRYWDGRHIPNEWHIGGRLVGELNEVAKERASVILAELPPLKSAIQIIAPSVVKQMEQRDALLAKVQALHAKYLPLVKPVDMDDHQSMTVGDFQQMVKDNVRKARAIMQQMNELGEDGAKLEDAINKTLYAGLPGLSEAVIQVIQDSIDRYRNFDTMSRRVEEQVRFGDNEAAMNILSNFEKDEVTVSDKVKAEFSEAMNKLKAAVKKGAKLTTAKVPKLGG